MTTLKQTLHEHAQDEGKQNALDVAQRWQAVLEEMAEASNGETRQQVGAVLTEVNEAIGELLK